MSCTTPLGEGSSKLTPSVFWTLSHVPFLSDFAVCPFAVLNHSYECDYVRVLSCPSDLIRPGQVLGIPERFHDSVPVN